MAWTLGMSDETFTAALKQLSKEERISVLAGLARGWRAILKARCPAELRRLDEISARKPE